MRTGPKHADVEAPIGRPSVWARSGSVLALTSQPARTTAAAFAQPLTLLVALPPGACGAAPGERSG